MYVCLRQRFGGFCLAEKDKYALIGVTGLDANARDLSPTWFKGSSESHCQFTPLKQDLVTTQNRIQYSDTGYKLFEDRQAVYV